MGEVVRIFNQQFKADLEHNFFNIVLFELLERSIAWIAHGSEITRRGAFAAIPRPTLRHPGGETFFAEPPATGADKLLK